MKTLKKLLALALACAALFALCACGSGEGGSGESENGGASVKGETQEWGNITVFVPEGNSLLGGSQLDAETPDSAWILLDENNTHYYKFDIVEKETAENSVATTKEVNADSEGAKDFTIEAGGVTWTGFAYVYGGSCDCFQLYGEVGGKCLLVGAAWHAYDSDETAAVLGSIKLK